MKAIKVQNPKTPFKIGDFKRLTPCISEVEHIITEDAYVHVGGKVVAVYKKVDFDLSLIRSACLSLKFEPYTRLSGLVANTININATPRNPLRDNRCQKTKFSKTQSRRHSIFLYYGKKVAIQYQKYFKKAYGGQIKSTYVGSDKVNSTYLIKGTPFTGGVINKNSAMGYHRDSANTKDGISCMIVLKNGVYGGELILPELNIGFACQDGYMLLFDGQKYIHGVTKINYPQNSLGYRYSIVYYNNKGMSLCLPPELEDKHYRTHLENLTEKHYQLRNTL